MDFRKDCVENKKTILLFCDKFTTLVGKITCHPMTFIIAFITIVIWAIFGNLYNYSHFWEKIMTGIIFIMIFILQQSQAKDTMSLQLKINELIAATKGASNRVLNIEDMTASELLILKDFYSKLSELSGKGEDLGQSHSVDEAKRNEIFKEEIVKNNEHEQ
jgi:low affinity Fe/Cu permease